MLVKAPPITSKSLSSVEAYFDLNKEELENKLLREDRCIRALRIEMRDFVESIFRDKRYKPFWTPVDPRSGQHRRNSRHCQTFGGRYEILTTERRQPRLMLMLNPTASTSR